MRYREWSGYQLLAFLGVRADGVTQGTSAFPPPTHEDHRIFTVSFCHEHPYLLPRGGGNVFPHKIGLDRKLAVSSVHEHRQLDRCRAAKIDQCVERGPHRSARVEDVVDEDDILPRHVE